MRNSGATSSRLFFVAHTVANVFRRFVSFFFVPSAAQTAVRYVHEIGVCSSTVLGPSSIVVLARS